MAVLTRTAGLIVSIIAFAAMGAGGSYWLLTRPCMSGFHKHRHWRSERLGQRNPPVE